MPDNTAARLGGIPQHGLERVCESIRVVRRNDDARGAVVQQLGHVAHRARHDGSSHRHRFEHRQRRALPVRRKAEHRAARQEIEDLVARDAPEELGLVHVRRRELVTDSVEDARAFLARVSDDPNRGSDRAFPQNDERVPQVDQALSLADGPHERNRRPPGRPRPAGGWEIDAVRNAHHLAGEPPSGPLGFGGHHDEGGDERAQEPEHDPVVTPVEARGKTAGVRVHDDFGSSQTRRGRQHERPE